MGRRKLVIRRLETKKERMAKFSKRKKGILKKAKELSVLCDVDLTLLMFSPTAKPSLFISENKNLIDILERLSKFTIEDREQRRAYTLKTLKKMYDNKTNTGASSSNPLCDRNEVLKSQGTQLQDLKEKLAEKSKILRDWQNPGNVQDLAQIRLMEQHLVASLGRLRDVKTRIIQEQISLEDRRE